jgi:hypothetical protein
MIPTYYRGEPLPRRYIDFHKRIHCARGHATAEPPTYWLTFTLPWRMKLYDINSDCLQRTWPRLSIGFRFRLGC